VCRQLARQGLETHLLAVDPSRADSYEESESRLRIHPVAPARSGAFALLAAVSERARQLVRSLQPDVLYIRPFPLDWLFLLRHVRRDGIPYVCELNSMIADEYRSKGQRLKGLVYEWFDARSIRGASGLVTVTDEISAWAQRISGVSRPTLVADNGVDPDQITMRTPETRNRVRERLGLRPDAWVLAMAGFGSPWHGFDRAISMLPHLDSATQLWLIGAENDDVRARAQQIAVETGVADRLRIFPRLSASELAELLSAADVGIGALAIDRKRMTEAQPIKVRFYLANGLPVLYNHRDPRLDPTLPFISLVESVRPEDIAAGAAKLRGLGMDISASARTYAERRLSWAAIAGETRAFLSAQVAPKGR
jgi:glycosyltransferase involved in cell wall biosynthesis